MNTNRNTDQVRRPHEWDETPYEKLMRLNALAIEAEQRLSTYAFAQLEVECRSLKITGVRTVMEDGVETLERVRFNSDWRSANELGALTFDLLDAYVQCLHLPFEMSDGDTAELEFEAS